MAQSPMKETARDFLKMILDQECGVVVMLCNLHENGQVGFRTCAWYSLVHLMYM